MYNQVLYLYELLYTLASKVLFGHEALKVSGVSELLHLNGALLFNSIYYSFKCEHAGNTTYSSDVHIQ